MVFGSISAIAIIYFAFCLFFYPYSIIKLRKEEAKLQADLFSLKDTEQNLKLEIQKLKDPDYIARYARENYLYSKNGELILKIDGNESLEERDKDKTITHSSKKYYWYVGIAGSIVTILVIVWLYKKKHKTTK